MAGFVHLKEENMEDENPPVTNVFMSLIAGIVVLVILVIIAFALSLLITGSLWIYQEVFD